LFVAKVAKLLEEVVEKVGDHPYEDLAKSDNKIVMKYKSLIILLYFFCYTLKTKTRNLECFTFFFPFIYGD
jgi:hypothetical protein